MAKPRELRRTYGFDEVAISPGALTVNPDMVDTARPFQFGQDLSFTRWDIPSVVVSACNVP